jgi:hypothetical protein
MRGTGVTGRDCGGDWRCGAGVVGRCGGGGGNVGLLTKTVARLVPDATDAAARSAICRKIFEGGGASRWRLKWATASSKSGLKGGKGEPIDVDR